MSNSKPQISNPLQHLQLEAQQIDLNQIDRKSALNCVVTESVAYYSMMSDVKGNFQDIFTLKSTIFLPLLLDTTIITLIERIKIVTMVEEGSIYMKISPKIWQTESIQELLTNNKLDISSQKFIQQNQEGLSYEIYLSTLCIIKDPVQFKIIINELDQKNKIDHFYIGDTLVAEKRLTLEDRKCQIQAITHYFRIILDQKFCNAIFKQLLDFLKQHVEFCLLQDFNCIDRVYCIQTFNFYSPLMVFKKCKQINIQGQFIDQTTCRHMCPVIKKHHPQQLQAVLNYHQQPRQLQTNTSKKDITNLLQQIANSYSTQHIQKDILFILNEWYIYRPAFEEHLEDLQNITEYRLHLFKNNYRDIFSSLVKLKNNMEIVNEYKGNLKDGRQLCIDNHNDAFLVQVIKQLEGSGAENNRRGQISFAHQNVAGKISKQLSTMTWHDTLAQLKIHYQLKKQNEAQNQQLGMRLKQIKSQFQKRRTDYPSKIILKQKQNRLNFINHIEQERLNSINYLCCCPFFYQNINIYDPFINKTPLYTMTCLKNIRNQTAELKDRVCYLMNHGGGVILFDCEKKHKDVLPIGTQFTLFDQQNQPQKIYQIIEGISPKVQVGVNIEVSLVPIIKNPLKTKRQNQQLIERSDKVYNQSYYQRQYAQGLFVTRIKVKPTQSWKTYYWISQRGPIIPLKISDNQFKPTKGQQFYRIMKQKMEKYYIPDQLTGKERRQKMLFTPPISCFHEGQCARPDSGKPLCPPLPQLIKNIPPQQRFQNMSLIISRKSDHLKIKLLLQQKGLSCQIVSLFPNQKFKSATNTAVIYHNQRFDKLLTHFNQNQDFVFSGKATILIFISQCLKLPNQSDHNYLSLEQFNNLQKNWLKRFYPDESLRFFRYRNQRGQNQYFLQSQSKMSTVLMYYVMSQYNHKCTFKNPKNFDKPAVKQKIDWLYPSHMESVQFELRDHDSFDCTITEQLQDEGGELEWLQGSQSEDDSQQP